MKREAIAGEWNLSKGAPKTNNKLAHDENNGEELNGLRKGRVC